MSRLTEAPSEEAALEQLHRDQYTDGLPVVIPTPTRVSDMLLAGGLDGDEMLGLAGPSQASVTAQGAAICTVMAGCLPEHFPVVVAGVRAICDPVFDLTEVQVTTHPVTPLLIVNGPVRADAGIASGAGAFGPGHRANASIGRAIRLVMMNLGGGRPGVSDMAVFGHPAKFTFCVAENEEASPFPPLHVSRGYEATMSAVTAVAVEGPHSVVCAPVPDGSEICFVAASLNAIASALGAMGSNSTYQEAGTLVVVLNPTLARSFAAAGYGRTELQRELVDRSRHSRRALRSVNPGLVPAGPADEMVPDRSPDTILILVAGGEGNYAMVCPTLGGGPHRNSPVTVLIEDHQFCELPPRDPDAASQQQADAPPGGAGSRDSADR